MIMNNSKPFFGPMRPLSESEIAEDMESSGIKSKGLGCSRVLRPRPSYYWAQYILLLTLLVSECTVCSGKQLSPEFQVYNSTSSADFGHDKPGCIQY